MTESHFHVEIPVSIKRESGERKVQNPGRTSRGNDPVSKIARLLALGHKWEGMVQRGEVKNYTEIAHAAGLTKGRVAQVCDLVLLAPGIQEALLEPERHLDRIRMRALRRVVSSPNWHDQRYGPGHEATTLDRSPP